MGSVELTRGEILKVAAAAGVDPRTVECVLDSERSPHPLVKSAVLRALRKLGYREHASRVEKGKKK